MRAPDTSYLLERAWVDGAVQDDVLVEVTGGRFTRVEVRGASSGFEGRAHPTNVVDPRSAGDPPIELPGLTLPGLANTHSHAFHRALRGRTQRGGGSFWTWREQMYDVAARLDPDLLFALARATYREMVAAGITAVGEFHYLHHQPDGTPYDEPNAMGLALVEAAREAGIRITLLDTLYLAGGFGEPPSGTQVRFSDGDAERWLARTERYADLDAPHALVGHAAHSVRAVPVEALEQLAKHRAATQQEGPWHVHLSEQVAENAACLAAHGVSPTRLLADHGLLGPATTVVHATHLDDRDVTLLGDAQVWASFCPTTERDLGDGVGPSRALREAGARITLGSDSQAVVDLFEEMRALELDERLATQRRGHWTAAELVVAATADGHASLGWDDAGAIEVGRRADLVTVDLGSPRTAGTGRDEHSVVFAAGAADVTHVVVDGWVVPPDRRDVGHELDDAIARCWP